MITPCAGIRKGGFLLGYAVLAAGIFVQPVHAQFKEFQMVHALNSVLDDRAKYNFRATRCIPTGEPSQFLCETDSTPTVYILATDVYVCMFGKLTTEYIGGFIWRSAKREIDPALCGH